MKKSLEPRTITAFFGIAVTVLFWISVMSYRSTYQMVLSFDAVSQAHQALDKLQHVDLLMESAESSVRDYVISGESKRLSPYRYALLMVPYELRQVDVLLSLYPQHQNTWKQLNHLFSTHMAELSKVVALRQIQGYDVSARRILTQDDAAKRAALDQLLSEFQQKERTELEDRRGRTSEHSFKTKTLLVMAGLMSLGLLGWAFSLLRHEADERRHAENATHRTETFLDSIVERIPYMILVKEAANLRLTLVNKAAEEWLGRQKEELLGSNEFDLRPREQALAAIEKDRQALRKETLSDSPEERLIVPGKEERVLQTQRIIIPGAEGHPEYLLTISEDITQRKLAEKMLELSRDAAVESARLKSEFIGNMSHEIRTPLSVMSGMTALLLDTSLTPEQRIFANTVQRAAAGLSNVAKSILDFSKIEAGRFALETKDVNVRKIVEDVVAMLGAQAKVKNVGLTSLIYNDIPSLVRGDAVRLRQVLTQLIGNAVKFTTQGEVTVRVIEVRQHGQTMLGDPPAIESRHDLPIWLQFRITDTGIGISEEAQIHLFEPFRQGDGSPTRRYGGTGMGLAVSKRIIDLMGGEIGFESAVGQGATFWFTIPFNQSHVHSPLPPAPASSWARARILIVDENQTVRQLIQQQLMGWALASEAVSSGEAAIALLRQEQQAGRSIPIAILDMHLPDMDGVDFARSIKADPSLAAVKLIVMMNPESPLDTSEALALGFSGRIAKPPKLEELQERLASLLDFKKPLNREASPDIPLRNES